MIDGHPITPYAMQLLAEILLELYWLDKNEKTPEENA